MADRPRKNWKKVAYEQAEALHKLRHVGGEVERLLAAALVPEKIDRAKAGEAWEKLRRVLYVEGDSR